MKWSEMETCKFVELYREQECLWNVDSVHYRNKQMKRAAMESIIKHMALDGLTVDDVKIKIKNLRGTYNQELSKINKSMKSGAVGHGVYIPNVKWFNIMDAFVRPLKEKILTKDNFLVLKREDDSEDIFAKGESEEQFEEDPGTPCPSPRVIAETARESGAGRNTKAAGSRKRRHHELASAVQELRQITNVLSEPDEDEFDAFGRFVGLSLKKMLLSSAMGAQSEIQSVLTRYRINEMNKSLDDTS